MRPIVPLTLATILLAACAAPPPFQPEVPPPALAPTPSSASSFDAASLAGSVWIAKDVGGIAAKRELQQKLQFVSASQVAGFGGCNSFTGSATASGSSLTIGPITPTQKACGGEAMAQEAFYFNALKSVRSARLEQDRLVLLDQSGKMVLELGKSD